MSDSYDDSEELDFSDPEGYVDDISDEDLLGDILSQKPKDSDVSQCVVIVDGLPEVGTDKVDKLRNHVKKLFKDCGRECRKDCEKDCSKPCAGGVFSDSFPLANNNKTKGFALLEMKHKAAAEEAVRLRNNHALDKTHTLSCYLQTEFNKYTNVPEKFVAPEPQKYQELGNLHYYLQDENAFDQFVVIYSPRSGGGGGSNSRTAIYSNSMPDPTLLEERPHWTETMCRWSPKGSYMATFHAKGTALWGREKFEQVQKFLHPGVQLLDFSPCEKYLITFSPSADNHGDEPKSIIIFDVRTGQKKRAFHNESRKCLWPVFKWSPNDKYFARLSKDQISVYETPGFGMLDKKSIKLTNVRDFSWSPNNDILAYWVAEHDEVPAKVSLMSFPSKQEIRSKNLFSVANCQIHWQKSGDYLCVCVMRYTKIKKDKGEVKYSGIYFTCEIFHMNDREIPVDSFEIKENIISFEWEPTGNKFGVISGEYPHINVTFYQVMKGQAPSELKRYEKKPYNAMFWSPRGQFVVLAGLKELSGSLEFIDTQNFTSMHAGEHFMVTNVEWDPTGRYVVTVVSWWEHKVDNAYWMWNFQGKILSKTPMDELCQFLWRPRPPSPITSADTREIKKKMKKYGAMFDLQDQMRSNRASQAIIDERRKLKAEFLASYASYKARLEQEVEARVELRGRDTSVTTEDETIEEVIEFLVKKETVAA